MAGSARTQGSGLQQASTTETQTRPPGYGGFLPVLLLLLLVIGDRLWLPSVRAFEPRYLLPLFNSFLFLAAGVIAYLAFRTYLISGAPSLLWLGSGVLSLGAGALAAGWLMFPFGPNVNVTIFNGSVLLAALCHMAGVLGSVEERPADPECRRRTAALGALATLAVVALLTGLTLTGVMPPFFIQGRGPTAIRQAVVEWAIVLLVFASLVILDRFRRTRAPFLYWYALALGLVAIAMLAFYLQAAVGSFIGWIGRSAYVLAAAYFLLAVRAAWREARTTGRSLDQALAQLFGPGLYWRDLLAGMSDAVVSYDDQGTILVWNRAAESIFGHAEAEMVGANAARVLPGITAIAASGPPAGVAETELQRRDGSAFSAETSISTKRTGAGAVVTLIIRDVTERRRAEAALRLSEEKFAKAFAANPAAIALTRLADGRFLDVNETYLRITGFSRDEVIGRTAGELGTWSDPEGRTRFVEALRQGGYIRGWEERFCRKSGEELVALLSAEVITVGDEKLVLSTYLDITERKQAEEALRTALADKDALLREVHHRVKNNLQMLCDLMYLQMEAMPDRDQHLDLQDAYGRIYAIARLHEQLYQSMQSGRIQLGQYLGRLAGGFEDLFPQARVKVNAAADGIALDLDRAIHVGLIVNELITNALKHAFPKGQPGEVLLTVRALADQVRLEVRDSGRGLPAHLDLERAKSVGLRTVYLLSCRLGGALKVERDGGTTFTLTFPLDGEAPVEPAP